MHRGSIFSELRAISLIDSLKNASGRPTGTPVDLSDPGRHWNFSPKSAIGRYGTQHRPVQKVHPQPIHLYYTVYYKAHLYTRPVYTFFPGIQVYTNHRPIIHLCIHLYIAITLILPPQAAAALPHSNDL